MIPQKRLLLFVLAILWQICTALPAAAHPAPFSYLDLHPRQDRIEGRLTVHAIDLAHELGIEQPQTLLDQGVLDGQYTAINDILRDRFSVSPEGGAPLPVRFVSMEPAAHDDAIRLAFVAEGAPPAALAIDANLFPHDPAHHTFVNVWEGDALSEQFLFGADSAPRVHYAGSAAGVAAVFATFVPSGAEHVWFGADHVLFIIGLILMGGSLKRLAVIVTAFTLGHSVTLALAALNIVSPPAILIEPLIALSIVVVGADNLLRGKGRDMRALFAGLFGLIHGFGFAYVLREFGLPQENLIWALLAFNIGVELGQLAIVIPLALVLAALRRRQPLVANRIAVGGSLAVIAAGAYWFVDRVRMIGSG